MDWSIYTRLCSTCRYGRNCALAPKEACPVWHCEGFEFQEAGAGDVQALDAPLLPVNRGQEQAPRGHQGLCDDCANSRNCSLTAVEGGIWHCEEYQ